MPDESCALVLMIGAVEDTGFVGLSLSTPEGPVTRVGMYFQDDKPGKGAFWFYSLVGGPVADAVLVFTITNAGLMLNLSLGGQKFTFKPLTQELNTSDHPADEAGSSER